MRNIAVVEDEDMAADLLISYIQRYSQLSGEKFNVSRFTNAADFLENYRAIYAVVFMDIQMPKMDGYEATKAIRSLPREDAASVPIIAITANAFREDMERALSCGMNDHLSKPVDVKKLQEILIKYCCGRE